MDGAARSFLCLDPVCDIVRVEFDQAPHFHIGDLSQIHPAINGFNANPELLRNLADAHQATVAFDRCIDFAQIDSPSIFLKIGSLFPPGEAENSDLSERYLKRI